MPADQQTFLERWFLGPHEPEERSIIGRLGLKLVESRLWERIFLLYILFNVGLKLTWHRTLTCQYDSFLTEMGLFACIIFTSEWLIELMALGARDFFKQGWYRGDTIVNLWNWGSYFVKTGYLTGILAYLFPNIAFLRTLRFLKPLGRVKFLFASKVVVTTVAEAISQMVPVLSLVSFMILLFSIMGVKLFGANGVLLYRCGVPLNYTEANTYFKQLSDFDSNGNYIPSGFFNNMNMLNCSVNWNDYKNYLKSGDRTAPEVVDLSVGGSPATCIALAPLTMCRCAGINQGDISNLYVPPICADPDGACVDSLCFQGGAYPISDRHGFSNFINGALTVIAIFFLKNWTLYLTYSVVVAKAELYAVIAWIYYFCLVIFGSFCLLNLTVATVSDIYSTLKKRAENKRKIANEKQAVLNALEAERAAMRANAKAAAKKDDDDADEERRAPLRFDSRFEFSLSSSRDFPFCAVSLYVGTAFKLWLLGPLLGMPFLHLLYFKGWYADNFIWKVVTFNFFFLGWAWDGMRMQEINQEASDADLARDQAYADQLNDEYERIDGMLELVKASRQDDSEVTLEWNLELGVALSWPDPHLTMNPLSISRAFILREKERMRTILGTDGEDGNAEADHADLPDEDDEDDEDEDESADQNPKEGGKIKEVDGQAAFAWFADLVVVANATSMAMQGFNDSLNPIITAVGYFATVFFVMESILKSIAYGGFTYYLSESSNKFDFCLVIVPTFGELVCQLCKAVFGREDYIYQMLALRALRVLRILKLVKHLTGLKRLASDAFKSPAGVFYAFLVTVIFIVIYALFGNEIFKTNVLFAANRNDYSKLFEALVAMVESLFGDRYYDNIEIGYKQSSYVGVFYFIIFYYICNFLVLRIFIAIILENFEFSEERKIAKQIQLFQKRQILQNDLINGRYSITLKTRD